MSGRQVTFEKYYTFLNYIPCRNERDRVAESIVHVARLDTWNATVVICPKKLERQGGYR